MQLFTANADAVAVRPLSQFVAEPAGDGPVEACFWECARQWQQLPAADESVGRAVEANCESYNAAVWQLFATACRQGRINPVHGLAVRCGTKSFTIPIDYCGFPWQPDDFVRIHLPPTGTDPLLQRRYECAGVGCPLVVERVRRECNPLEAKFFPEKSFFAATLVLEFEGPAANAKLTFYDPLSVRTTKTGQPLAKDLTAPLAMTLEAAPRTYFAGFIEPGGATNQPRLTMLEPYQPGKTPLVLIHGLFSDPQSWADMINDLRAAPGFSQRHQIWVFRYPTGRGFLQSATALRTEMRALVAALDPTKSDPALHHIVLVGHSMGGLIAKLQVTHSAELVWNELANQPLETIATSEQARGFLAENCYFDPSPNVDRVIFIATPHAGSVTSSGLVGRGASMLVETAPTQAAMHQQLIDDNPGTFNPQFTRRLPTSIDMLEPQSPLLDVMRQMRVNPCVKLHNVIGAAVPLSLDGPSDGVVSVRSAKHPGCQSVIAFNAMHSKVHRDLRTSCEVLRILNTTTAQQPLP
ncbi:esterase/lipase family protein [Anatilimnocola floriformis]|uniref:esterase/lipase family protein n=1 Tax=Anatilimnocola floriformis TaxID=2948575 RepID=UPI0020C4CBD8|nr:alpha/beta fold hydrolase [Anatilimnocola floriformis]